MPPNVRHPYTGSAHLQWQRDANGVHYAYKVRKAKYRAGAPYDVREPFAWVRPTYNANGVFVDGHGFIVTRGGFEDLMTFDTLAAARLHVESVFALESD